MAKRICLALLLLCALGAVSCGPSPAATGRKAPETAAGGTTPRTQQPGTGSGSGKAYRAFKRYLEAVSQTGATPSWLRHISDFEIHGQAMEVVTDLASSQGSDAEEVCEGVSGFVYDEGRSFGLNAVRVFSVDGHPVVSREREAEPCRAGP